MPTDLETALANVQGLIAEITATPKPSYSVNGQSVSWSEYLANLMAQEEALQKRVNRASLTEIETFGL